MKRAVGIALLVITIIAVLLISRPTRALPEYSAQTGEPCATCHISPSGGGLRTPRGQAWVGNGRPGAVPALNDALALLGVRLKVNAQDFVAGPGAVREPAALPAAPAYVEQMKAWLRAHEGN
jgi:hypothetical protein